MTNKLKWAAAALAALIVALPLAACSKSGGTAQAGFVGAAVSGGSASGSDGSASKRIVGKVTAIVGNRVTLAIGTLNNAGFGGQRGEQVSASSASSASSGTSSGASSGGITLTGETQDVLIPVGLSVTKGRSGIGEGQMPGGMSGGAQGGTASGSRSGFSGRTRQGGTASGSTGGYARYGGWQTPAGGSKQSGTASGSAGGTTGGGSASSRTTISDFSTIKAGMILQITERAASDGSYEVAAVRIVSES